MEFEYYSIALIPLIMGLVEIVKKFKVPKKWVPVVSVVIGMAFGFGILTESFDAEGIRIGVVSGLYMGLSASGLHSANQTRINSRNVKIGKNE